MLEHGEERANSAEYRFPSLPHLVYIKATVEGLKEPIVEFALLHSDPIVEFQRALATYEEAMGGDEPLSVITVLDAWNRQLEDVSPAQKFFVWAWSSVRSASPAVVRKAGLLCAITTPGQQQRRWFTTWPIWRKGELVAWCQSIDLKAVGPRQVTIVTVSEQRMLHLAPALTLPDDQLAYAS